MRSPDMGMGAFQSPDENEMSKISKRAREMKESIPARHLPEVISELKQYKELRMLDGTPKGELPDDLRRAIGTRNPGDEFIERVENFEPWDALTDTYGFTPESKTPKWTINEIEQLINKLEQ